MAAAWYYTGGSHPYGYLGLGEVMVFVFFGLVAVVGTTYVQIETWSSPRSSAAVGIGALACAILVVNNLRDIPTDAEVGKRTLAVVLGARAHPAALRGPAWCWPRGGRLAVAAPTTWWALAGLAFLGRPARGVRTVLAGATGPGLIPVLQQTGLAELLWAALVFVPLVALG